jgi:hypothetical protein
MMNDHMTPYNRIQKFADQGIVKDVQIESAKIEATCRVASELALIRQLLETVIDFNYTRDAGTIRIDDGRG